MKKTMIIVTLLLWHVTLSFSFNYALIKDFLNWKNLRMILLMSCDLEHQITIRHTIDYLLGNNIWFNHYDMSNSEKDLSDLDYANFFVRLSGRYVVAIDLECNCTRKLLEEISKRKMFHFERSWLLFGRTTEQLFSVLRKENINVDADVMSVVPFGYK